MPHLNLQRTIKVMVVIKVITKVFQMVKTYYIIYNDHCILRFNIIVELWLKVLSKNYRFNKKNLYAF